MSLKEFIFAILDRWEQSLNDPAFVKNPITVAHQFIRETKELFKKLDETRNNLSNEVETHFVKWQKKVVSERDKRFEWDNRYTDNLLAASIYRDLLDTLKDYPSYNLLALDLMKRFNRVYKRSLKNPEFAQFKRTLDQQVTAACNNLLTYPAIMASDDPVQFTIACDENTTPPHVSTTAFNSDGSSSTSKLPISALLPSELTIGSTKITAVIAIKPSGIEPTLVVTVDSIQKSPFVIEALRSPAWTTDIDQIGPIALAYNNTQQKLFIVSNRAGQLAYVSANFNPATGTISSISNPIFPFNNLQNTIQSSPSIIINPHTGTPIIAAQISDKTTGRVRAVVATPNGIIELGAIKNNNNGPNLTAAADNTFIVTLNSATGISQQAFTLNGTAINSPELVVTGDYGNASCTVISSGPYAGYSATAFDDGSNAYGLIFDTLQRRKQITLGVGTHAKVDTKTHGIFGFTWKQNRDAMFTTYALDLPSPPSLTPLPVQQPLAGPLPVNPPNAIAPIAAPGAQPPISSSTPSTYAPTFFQPEIAPAANVTRPPDASAIQNLGWLVFLPAGLVVIALIACAYIYNKKRQNHIESLGDKFLNNLDLGQIAYGTLELRNPLLLDDNQKTTIAQKRKKLSTFDFLVKQFNEAISIIVGRRLNDFDDNEVRQLIELFDKETQPLLRFWVWELDLDKERNPSKWKEKLKQTVDEFLQMKKERAHEGTELLASPSRPANH